VRAFEAWTKSWRSGVDTSLSRLFDDAPDHDGQIECPMKDQHTVVGQKDCRDTWNDCGANVGNRRLAAARTVTGHGYSVRKAEHRERLHSAADRRCTPA
jgi:hypothetical protein